jgi:hypothetical protein
VANADDCWRSLNSNIVLLVFYHARGSESVTARRNPPAHLSLSPSDTPIVASPWVSPAR